MSSQLAILEWYATWCSGVDADKQLVSESEARILAIRVPYDVGEVTPEKSQSLTGQSMASDDELQIWNDRTAKKYESW